MGEIHYLSFRDLSSRSTGVTVGQVYRQGNVDDTLADWTPINLKPGDWTPWSEVDGVFRGRRVCFIVHGFNVNADHGIKGSGPAAQEFAALGRLGLAMSGADLVVPVLWPGDGFILTSYFNAFKQAAETGRRFAEFLSNTASVAAEVSFISHSLGARVVLETVTRTALKSAAMRERMEVAILTAPAVDDTTLDDAEFAPGIEALRRIVVISSTADRVLKYAFTAGDLVEAAMWSSYDGNGRALGRFGPRFGKASSARAKTEWYEVADWLEQRHSDYLPEGWKPSSPAAAWVAGWSHKRDNLAGVCRDLIDEDELDPRLPGSLRDKTHTYRDGWSPRLASRRPSPKPGGP